MSISKKNRVGRWGRTLLTGAMVAAILGTTAQTATAAAPGQVISVTAQAEGFHGSPGGSVIEYWTTDSHGSPVRASGAMLLPSGPSPVGGLPILAFDHGTTGLGAGCGSQADPQPWLSPDYRRREDELMRYFVSRGFAVLAPDYVGLGRFDTGPHPYLELRTEATATIDLVRAARAGNPELSRTWAVAGGSQGGHAALGTTYLQRSAAPDLDFRGTIAIDPASDIEKVLAAAGPGFDLPGATGFVAMILEGLRTTRPDADIDSYLSPTGRAVVADIATRCEDDIRDRVHGLKVGDLLSRPLSDEHIKSVLSDYLTVPTSGYRTPILLLINATDTVVPSPLHAALAAQLTASGTDLQVVTGTGTHTELGPQMSSALDGFVTQLLAKPAMP
ncbi:alpha/beta fold hydrolase [Nocardia panacis]|uniref:Alpha/beta fold hydrolase n=1 Tax=Nocardia panacis TaxID=2340916 RepID=A0A3A4KSS0_9NOCA|nr:alpha/beta fold hydrolase [Nocardia panacis]RJO79175.1 alpha/beta fold hydrolase [Nocardia panacis]